MSDSEHEKRRQEAVWSTKPHTFGQPNEEAEPAHPGYRGEEFTEKFMGLANEAADKADPKRAEKEAQSETDDQYREVVRNEPYEELPDVAKRGDVRRNVRVSTGMSAAKVGRILGMPANTVEAYERGEDVGGVFERLLTRFTTVAARIQEQAMAEAEATLQAQSEATTGNVQGA